MGQAMLPKYVRSVRTGSTGVEASQPEGVVKSGAYWHPCSQRDLLKILAPLVHVLKLVNLFLIHPRDVSDSCFCAGSCAKCSSMLFL